MRAQNRHGEGDAVEKLEQNPPSPAVQEVAQRGLHEKGLQVR